LLRTSEEREHAAGDPLGVATGTLVASHQLWFNPDGDRTRDESSIQNADGAGTLDQTADYAYTPDRKVAEVTKTGAQSPASAAVIAGAPVAPTAVKGTAGAKQVSVHWTAPEGFRPYWAITKYADILEIEKLNDQFHNEPRSVLMNKEAEAGFAAPPLPAFAWMTTRSTNRGIGLPSCGM